MSEQRCFFCQSSADTTNQGVELTITRERVFFCENHYDYVDPEGGLIPYKLSKPLKGHPPESPGWKYQGLLLQGKAYCKVLALLLPKPNPKQINILDQLSLGILASAWEHFCHQNNVPFLSFLNGRIPYVPIPHHFFGESEETLFNLRIENLDFLANRLNENYFTGKNNKEDPTKMACGKRKHLPDNFNTFVSEKRKKYDMNLNFIMRYSAFAKETSNYEYFVRCCRAHDDSLLKRDNNEFEKLKVYLSFSIQESNKTFSK